MHAPKHIVITGASSGLGAALALEYAALGTHLSLHGRNRDRLAKVALQAHAKGATTTVHVGDVTDRVDLKNWIENADRLLAIDMVIANAGVSGGTAMGHETADQARAIFAVNFDGILNTIQPVLPLMTHRRRGQIALISSLASFRGFPGAPAYCASKAAVRIYGEALRSDMAQQNVQINVVCPGFIKTPMTDVNKFKMPLLMEAGHAAHIIRLGLKDNRARIAFPFSIYAMVRCLAALPQPIIEAMSHNMPRKS